MLISHAASICIVCLKESFLPNGVGLSEEHVIPAALGGILSCRFLCKHCNDGFGEGFEAKAKTDPSIRLAIGNLKNKLPKLYDSIEKGQPHLLRTGVGALPGKYHEGKVSGRTVKMPDNSLTVPEELTHNKLRELLTKDGLRKVEIGESLKRFDSYQAEREIEIAPGTSVAKRITTHGGPDLSNGELLDPLVCLKIIYEFAVLLFGPPVLANDPALNEVRRALREQDSNSKSFNIDRLMAEKYAPLHGLAFEGNLPYATFQIRLFGRLAYRVRLPNLAFEKGPVIYTHNLLDDSESLNY